MRSSVWLASCLLSACWSSSPPPAPQQPLSQPPPKKAGSLTVRCEFHHGWVAVVPRSLFKREEEYTMQALIGLTEDPRFWKTLPEYDKLQPYAAQPCSEAPAVFQGVGADAVLLVGKAGTFDQTNGYGINGAIRDVNGATDLKLTDGDLDMSWPCISCPRIYVWTGRGWELRGEVLVDVIGARAERTQRKAIGKVRVVKGEVRLRLAEEEDEVSHIDALVLEIHGVRAVPSSGPLGAIDGARTTMVRGDAIDLRYAVNLSDGEYDGVVAATGYYVPFGKRP